VDVTLAAEEALTLVLERESSGVRDSWQRRPADYEPCGDPARDWPSLEAREQQGGSESPVPASPAVEE
jgi:hypothetical protein